MVRIKQAITFPKRLLVVNIPQNEPYYPVNNEKNNKLYQKYKELADKEEKVIFGGRLGEYKYYDMDAVIEAAFRKAREVL